MEGSLSAADIFARLPDAASAKAPEELDARITAAFAENAKSAMSSACSLMLRRRRKRPRLRLSMLRSVR